VSRIVASLKPLEKFFVGGTFCLPTSGGCL